MSGAIEREERKENNMSKIGNSKTLRFASKRFAFSLRLGLRGWRRIHYYSQLGQDRRNKGTDSY